MQLHASRSVRRRDIAWGLYSLTHYIHAFLLSLTSVVSGGIGIAGLLDCWTDG